jgi:dipeptidyl aminopeptidase/acylaminoacyl peptidase
MPEQQRRPGRRPGPGILRRQVVVEEHDLAPDGSFAVISRRVVEGTHYTSSLWLIPLDGGAAARRGRMTSRDRAPRRLTTGPLRDMRPRISPDGSRVAFTRRDPANDDAPTGIRVLDLAGGEPRSLPLGELSASEIAWSPDGRRLAFTAETGPQRLIVGRKPARGEPLARRVTRLDYRYDERGYLDRWSQLHVVPADGTGRVRQLTDFGGGVSGIVWRPDGRAIGFVADPRQESDRRPRSSIWLVGSDARHATAAAGDVDELLALRGPVRAPAWSPDGAWIAGVGVDVADPFDDLAPTLFVGPADGSRPAVPLAPDLDRPIGNWADTDLTGWMADARPGPIWETDGSLVALVSDRGRTHPWRFPFDPDRGRPSGDPVRLASGDVMCQTLAVGGGRVSVTATVGARPPELCLVGPSGTVRPVTTLGSAWMRRLAWPGMRAVEAPGPGGPIETWIASPAGADDRPLPTVVDVHGGPLGAWAPAPSLEVVLLCARGYRVVLPNIRGSATYGAEWIAPQLGDWGGVDAADVHAALDHVIDLGLADPDRLGVLGLSYGGFMVNWLVGTTDRFRAAVSENGVTNQVSAWAHSDEGPEYCRAARMGDPTTPEGVDQLWRQSPLRHVANVRTPLLMLQSEADRRCPFSDNEQYFVTLRWLGREVEYVLYPEEFHVIQATGRIDRRIDRMTRVLDWFDRYLGADVTGVPTRAAGRPAAGPGRRPAEESGRRPAAHRVRSA